MGKNGKTKPKKKLKIKNTKTSKIDNKMGKNGRKILQLKSGNLNKMT